jgi:hypothetical protein
MDELNAWWLYWRNYILQLNYHPWIDLQLLHNESFIDDMMNRMIDESWWIDWMTERRDAFTWLQSDRQLWLPPGLSIVMQSLTVIGPLHQVIGSSGFGRQMVGCVQCRQNWRWRQSCSLFPGCYLALGPALGKSGIGRNMAVAALYASSGGNPPSPPLPHHLSLPPPPFAPRRPWKYIAVYIYFKYSLTKRK